MNYFSYLLKLKFYLGTKAAFRVFYDKCIKKGDISVPFIKYRFKLRHDDFADNQIFNYVILRKCYWGIADKNKISRIIDLGAHMGLSAVSFLSEYPHAELIAVEPDPDNFKVLVENTMPYNFPTKRVHCYNTAVYNQETELFLTDPSSGSHGFQIVQEKSKETDKTIRTVTVNGLLKKHGWDYVDIVKINIEGAEKELFESNTEWLIRTKFLIVETHDRIKNGCTKSLFKALDGYQYKMRILEQNLIFTLFYSKSFD